MTANEPTKEPKLSRKYEAFIAALLTEATIAEAAKKAGISEATALRWLKLPDVQTAYRAARREVVQHALASIQRATSEAVEALQRNLHATTGAVQVSAARALLEYAVRAVEIDDLGERVERIEEALEAQQDSGHRQQPSFVRRQYA